MTTTQQSVSLRPQPDRNKDGEWIAWAQDGGLVNLPRKAGESARGLVRVVLQDTGRKLGNGKPVYNATPAPDFEEFKPGSVRYEVSSKSSFGGFKCWTVNCTDWLGNMATREEREEIPASREVVVRTISDLPTLVGEEQVVLVTYQEYEIQPLGPRGYLRADERKRRQVGQPTSPEQVAEILTWRVHWELKSGRVPKKVSPETKVEAIVRLASGKVVVANTTWGELTPARREVLLARYPVCPVCGKERIDATRGVNACDKCLTLDELWALVEPYVLAQAPDLEFVGPAPSGKSLLFQIPDEATSFKFAKGYKVGWDADVKALSAGKAKLLELWDRFRAQPTELIDEVAPVFALLGLSLQPDQIEPRTIYIQGPWIEGLKAHHRKSLGPIKGKKKAYFVNGLEALLEVFNRFVAALTGRAKNHNTWDQITGESGKEFPAPPAGWVHGWWVD